MTCPTCGRRLDRFGICLRCDEEDTTTGGAACRYLTIYPRGSVHARLNGTPVPVTTWPCIEEPGGPTDRAGLERAANATNRRPKVPWSNHTWIGAA